MIGTADRKILRELGKQKFDIGSMPVQKETLSLWRRLNSLERTRPLVWINEIPWHELARSGELDLRCADNFARAIESGLRMELYQWKHFPCDMVVDPVVYSDIVGGPGGSYADYGIQEKVRRDEGGKDVGFLPIILTEADADRVRTPEVSFDVEATARNFSVLSEVFDGVIPVRRRGIVHQWHSPWDQMIHWYGIEQLYTDMYDKPELVHRLLRNFMRALHSVVDRQIELGMLDVGNGNWRVGSGGMGVTDELPATNPDGHKVLPAEQWGCATAQIFSEVSPEMHEEFALQYERPLLHRFGLTYYGCCEPLHTKIGILRSVKNLRKISMSPWINLESASEQMGTDYVFSFKPNPSHLAMDGFDEDMVRSYLRNVAAKTRENRREFILKDVTTVRDDPARLDRWARVAMEVAREC